MNLKAEEKPLVFAVDDDRENVDLVIRTLAPAYQVRGFTDPVVAVNEAGSSAPMGVVTDYRMPNLDGLAMLKAIRQEGIRPAVLMVTAFSELDEVIYAEQSKLFYRLLPKPWKPEYLRSQMDLAMAEVFERMALQRYQMLVRGRKG